MPVNRVQFWVAVMLLATMLMVIANAIEMSGLQRLEILTLHLGTLAIGVGTIRREVLDLIAERPELVTNLRTAWNGVWRKSTEVPTP